MEPIKIICRICERKLECKEEGFLYCPKCDKAVKTDFSSKNNKDVLKRDLNNS